MFGDVHDIGKSLVNTILTNNGYTVFDLGKQVPINVIIDKAVEVDATAIGLSALLVNTSKQMPLCVQELHKRGLDYPVLIGGAAINRPFGARIGLVGADEAKALPPGVYYCRDAFEGLDTMEALTDPGKRASFVERKHREATLLLESEAHRCPGYRSDRSERADHALQCGAGRADARRRRSGDTRCLSSDISR